ncbi:C-X-C motif chemokine 10-like [Betta splendens]|uniref:C-X-C motif chemokine 10-like n=1 Tax=Betta splendens TaxID=158456 RepID=A0A6P7NQX9_BETSP|nr:C-X-C motif chemokine 10-like [Betta splendens]
MSSILKVFLLLAALVCISTAQLNETGQQCLCRRVRNGIAANSEVKDIQIYPATIFCDKVEIVVTMNNGYRLCLNPKLNAVQKMLAKVMKKKAPATTASQTVLTSNPTSTA